MFMHSVVFWAGKGYFAGSQSGKPRKYQIDLSDIKP